MNVSELKFIWSKFETLKVCVISGSEFELLRDLHILTADKNNLSVSVVKAILTTLNNQLIARQQYLTNELFKIHQVVSESEALASVQP